VRRHAHPVLVASHAGAPPLLVHAAFVTDDRLLAVIHLLKFGRRQRVAPWLARAMLRALPPSLSDISRDAVVVPVPMDRSARRRRGFNQAESIARTLAAGWELPVSARALVKVRRTRPQSALGREARLINLAGAFQGDPEHVRERRTILVDDLVTTGATVHACAGALRHAGAREVAVICAGYRDEARGAAGPFRNLDNDLPSA
jgi:ComF family protein